MEKPRRIFPASCHLINQGKFCPQTHLIRNAAQPGVKSASPVAVYQYTEGLKTEKPGPPFKILCTMIVPMYFIIPNAIILAL